MKNNKLFVLVGKSASGKSTILNDVLSKLDIPVLLSNTTRPPRDNEIDGVDYNFVDMHTFDTDYKNENILEYDVFRLDSLKQTWVYYTKKSDLLLPQTSQIKVVSPTGLAQLMSNKELKDNIVSIFIDCHDRLRQKRYLTRCISPDSMSDRFERDEKAFQHLFTDYIILNDENTSIHEASNQLIDIIEKELKN